MQEYRGIKVDDSVKLYKKDGSFNLKTVTSLEKMLERSQRENHQILGVYKGASVKILINFNCLHKSHMITPNKYTLGEGCPICSGKSSGESQRKFLELAEKLNYEVVGVYKNNNTYVEMKCPLGHVMKTTTPHNFKNGARCSICSGTNLEEAKKTFLSLVKKEGFVVLEEYKNGRTPIEMCCPNNHKKTIAPHHFVNGTRCSICSRKNMNKAKEEFFSLVQKEGYTLLGEYKNNRTPIKMKCENDHVIDTLRPTSFKNGNRCLYCTQSKGEREIKKYLDDMCIESISQHSFTEERFRYDFFIPKDNLIIEIHGVQHYKEVEHFTRTLKEEKKNDRHKEEYARSLGYNYMIVDYREGKPQLTLERFKKQYAEFKEKN